jgi:nucleotidyltransferase substrate binding protein (TIGR01987 family)
MNTEDLRWLQRLSNYNKVMNHLDVALKIQNPDMVQKAGIIQLFEVGFELAWKMLKDYLEEQGFQEVNTPRSALKKAFESGLIENGHDWMELLADRKLTTHTYHEEKAAAMEVLIEQKYQPLLKALQITFNRKSIEG